MKLREAYGQWRKGQATHEDYKDFVRLFWEKIRKAKVPIRS